jgi:hypothetical protein
LFIVLDLYLCEIKREGSTRNALEFFLTQFDVTFVGLYEIVRRRNRRVFLAGINLVGAHDRRSLLLNSDGTLFDVLSCATVLHNAPSWHLRQFFLGEFCLLGWHFGGVLVRINLVGAHVCHSLFSRNSGFHWLYGGYQQPDANPDYRDHNEATGHFIQLIVPQFIRCGGGHILLVVLVHCDTPSMAEHIALMSLNHW